MRRTTPPILNDRRISCFVTTMPLVSMGGTAGPLLALLDAHRRGLPASGASLLPQPASSAATSTSATIERPVNVPDFCR